jgi:hypothetical protein
LREAHWAESGRLLGVFGEVLSVVREAVTPAGTESEDPQPGGGTAETSAPDGTAAAEQAGRLVLKTLDQAGGLEALSSAHEAVSAHHGNNYLPLLDRHYRSHRFALFTLVDSIELEASSADRSVLEAVEFLRAPQRAHRLRARAGDRSAGRPGR